MGEVYSSWHKNKCQIVSTMETTHTKNYSNNNNKLASRMRTQSRCNEKKLSDSIILSLEWGTQSGCKIQIIKIIIIS